MSGETRIGTDIVGVDEVRQALTTHGERYLARVYTAAERADCGSNPARLAARFAAKEALVKALRVVDGGTPPLEIETVLVGGLPEMTVYGSLADRLHEAGLTVTSVSLAHAECHAIATVLLAPGAGRWS